MSKKEGKKKHPKQIIKGTLDVTRSGMGYVIVEGLDKDIIVRPHDFNRAFHGDTVSVKVTDPLRGKRLEGKVDEVLERKKK